ncbi:hypothetical protein SAMN04244553_3652 [Nocardia amikacinitolerans]|uniref:DUF3558 domain-containing protein n=1 Tax=Nocardia amikacinitolerans TaxID=756689 RepID=A0A285LLS4_9NOCA|nr:hypothetical protein SAMN04244553_3652 [Nocardia amikacinitolerans]
MDGTPVKIGLLNVAATAVLALVAGCSSSQPSTTPAPSQARSVMTQGQLCDVLKNFFTSELHAVEARAIPNVSTDTALTVGGVCELAQGANPIGSYQVRNAPDEPDPTQGRRGYLKRPELGEAVWVYDMRTDTENPSNTVRFATRINKWNAILEIRDSETRTATGELHLNDGDKRKSVQFLTELTTKLAV